MVPPTLSTREFDGLKVVVAGPAEVPYGDVLILNFEVVRHLQSELGSCCHRGSEWEGREGGGCCVEGRASSVPTFIPSAKP